MTTQPLPLKQLSNNPWQLWPLDPAHVADLAAEYAAGAPLPPIVVRLAPAKAGGYEIAVGHHRVAARLQLHLPDIPAEVRELSDLEMARLAVVENFKRRIPSALDKAHALRRLTTAPFNLSQADAGRTLGYTNQGAVSHLLRLLELPAPIQAHVAAGALPERLARQLVSVSRSLPQVALAVAEKVAKAAADKEGVFEDTLSDAVRQKGRPMWDAPWPTTRGGGDWTPPAAVIPYIADVAQKLGLETLPACQGCEFHLTVGGEQCARPACFDAKVSAWRWAEVGKAAKSLGVTLAAPGEAVKLIFDGNASEKRLAEAALKSKHASLRLVPTARAVRDYESETRARADLLGSKFAALSTTDWPALKKAFPALPASATVKADKPKSFSQAENDKRRKAVQAEAQAVGVELKRLVRVAAEVLAPSLPDHERLLQLLLERWEWEHGPAKAKSLKAKKVAVMVELIESHAQDVLGDRYDWDTPDGFRAGLVALLRLFKKPVPAALAAPPEPQPTRVVRLNAMEKRIERERARMPHRPVKRPKPTQRGRREGKKK